MFSGIITNQASVFKKESRKGQIHFVFRLKKPMLMRLGESIAVNGVCLTVAKFGKQTFEADVMSETLKATTLGLLQLGDQVNLEPSLKVGDEIGGHFVTGHVDGIGEIKRVIRNGKNVLVWIRSSSDIVRFLAQKGSVACDGISLTVQEVSQQDFKIGLVPHTLKVTTLGDLRIGKKINLEIDLITRYLAVLSQEITPRKIAGRETTLKISNLLHHGF